MATFSAIVGEARDQRGQIVPGALVTVRAQSTGALVNLYSAADTSVSVANPYTAGADGFYNVRTDYGDAVRISVSGDVAADHVDLTSASGLSLIQEFTPSAASSVDLTSVMDSASYSGYVVNAVFASGTADYSVMELRTSTDNGSSWASNAGDYRTNAIRLAAGSVSGIGTTTASWLYCGYTVGGLSSGEGFNCRIRILDPHDATRRTRFLIESSCRDSLGAIRTNWITGFRVAAEDNNAVQIFPAVSTVSGTVSIYGVPT